MRKAMATTPKKLFRTLEASIQRMFHREWLPRGRPTATPELDRLWRVWTKLREERQRRERDVGPVEHDIPPVLCPNDHVCVHEAITFVEGSKGRVECVYCGARGKLVKP